MRSVDTALQQARGGEFHHLERFLAGFLLLFATARLSVVRFYRCASTLHSALVCCAVEREIVERLSSHADRVVMPHVACGNQCTDVD